MGLHLLTGETITITITKSFIIYVTKVFQASGKNGFYSSSKKFVGTLMPTIWWIYLLNWISALIPLLCISLREYALETWLIWYVCSLEKGMINVMGTPGQYVILCHLVKCLGTSESAEHWILSVYPAFLLLCLHCMLPDDTGWMCRSTLNFYVK